MVQSPVAEVLAVDAGRAWVSVERGAACPRCAAGRGCGAGLLTGTARNAHIEIVVSDGMRLSPGDRVSLSLAGAKLLRAAACAYGLPLAGTIGALALGRTLLGTLPDLQAAFIAAAGLLGGWLAGRQLLRQSPCLLQLQPEIVGRGRALE